MIRLLTCLKKRDDISDIEFREYWNSQEFQALFDEMVSQYRPSRFSRNLTLKIAMNTELMEYRGAAAPFDATLEYWWNSAADLEQGIALDESSKLFERMIRFQEKFCDMSEARTFFTEYNEQ